jgi:4a-hydroxytetrahydrobiopterin dehydratase
MRTHPGQDMVAALAARVGKVTLLTEEEIATALGTLRGWTRSGDSISSTVELADFREAMLFTGAVAYLAEVANHHPDILIQWNRVTLTLSTHSEGGLTAADMALAGQISTLR